MQAIAERVGYAIVYGLVGIYATVDKCCSRRRPTYTTSAWEAVDLDTKESTCAADYHQLDRKDADVILHHVRKYHGLHVWDSTVVQWTNEAGRGYDLADVFESPVAPWFFIGYVDEEGKTVDCTEFLDNLVVGGNRITLPLLRYLRPLSGESKWVYVNPKTFDQVEFPSEGILIGDDVNVPPPPTESAKDD
jgi:hypothetical protein